MSELKDRTVKGMIWGAAERFSVQGTQFVIMLIMARLLTPRDYGLVGMLAIFLAVAQSLVDSGFSQALIRKLDRSQLDNSTVFYFNIVFSVILYAVLFAAAPWVSDFYAIPELTEVMRVISLVIIINAFAVVQRALFSIRIDFKSQAKAGFTASVISGIVGITLAATGFGVWAIVGQQLVNAFVNVAMLWIMASWRPSLCYSWRSFKTLFAFGSKLMVSALLDRTWTNIYGLVIGKVFSASTLGFYTRAMQFVQFPTSNATGILQSVSYPALCTLQNDNSKLPATYRKFLKLSAFIIFPLTMLLAGSSRPMISILLGAKWEFCAILLTILCFSMMWYPIHAINLNLLMVKGRSDLFLRLELIKKCFSITILLVTLPFGIIALCAGQIASSLIALAINTHYTGRLIGIGFWTQMRDLVPSLLLSLAIFAASMGATFISGNHWIQITVGCAAATMIFIISIKIFKFGELSELTAIFRRSHEAPAPPHNPIPPHDNE